MEKTKKELCRMRIKVLQEAKEDLAKNINPLLGRETADLYLKIGENFDEVVDIEARFLADL